MKPLGFVIFISNLHFSVKKKISYSEFKLSKNQLQENVTPIQNQNLDSDTFYKTVCPGQG